MMKQQLLPALRLTGVCLVFFSGIYTLAILAISQAAPNRGLGETVSLNGKIIGYKLEGQNFSSDEYFWSRPSAAGYNAASSGGSNKGPSNAEYLQQVKDRIKMFRLHNPGIGLSPLPSELVTTSGSGLDPDLSPAAARIQVKRIAAIRKLEADKINLLIERLTQKPLLGPEHINLLSLNLELDKLK